MTDTLLDYDPNDTGDIPTGRIDDLSTEPTRDLRAYRDLGEPTQRINPILRGDSPFPSPLRHNNTVPDSLVTGHGYDPEANPGPIIEMDNTVTFHVPDQAAAQPIAPLERVADETAVHSILDSLAGARAGLDGELEGPQKPPPPLPKPPSQAVPGKGRRYAGRHRKAVQGTSWWPLIGFVVGAAVALSGLLVVL